MHRLVLILCLLTAGCASVGDCYFEIGVGSFINDDGHTNKVPTTADAYCERGSVSYGLYHQSDITRGKPWNSKEELSITTMMVKYKVKVN